MCGEKKEHWKLCMHMHKWVECMYRSEANIGYLYSMFSDSSIIEPVIVCLVWLVRWNGSAYVYPAWHCGCRYVVPYL